MVRGHGTHRREDDTRKRGGDTDLHETRTGIAKRRERKAQGGNQNDPAADTKQSRQQAGKRAYSQQQETKFDKVGQIRHHIA
jgi:hypothetical protein